MTRYVRVSHLLVSCCNVLVIPTAMYWKEN